MDKTKQAELQTRIGKLETEVNEVQQKIIDGQQQDEKLRNDERTTIESYGYDKKDPIEYYQRSSNNLEKELEQNRQNTATEHQKSVKYYRELKTEAEGKLQSIQKEIASLTNS